MFEQAKTVSLVMATASVYERKPPLPLRVFEDHAQAENWRETLLDYHLSPPELPHGSDDKAEWQDYEAQLAVWRTAHPAGEAASHYTQFGIYEIPQGL